MPRKSAAKKQAQQQQAAANKQIPGTAEYGARKEEKAASSLAGHPPPAAAASAAPAPAQAPGVDWPALPSGAGGERPYSSDSAGAWASPSTASPTSSSPTTPASSPPAAAAPPAEKPATIYIPDCIDGQPPYRILSPRYLDTFSHNADATAQCIAPKPEKKGKSGWGKAPTIKRTAAVRSTERTYWYVRCTWAGYSDYSNDIAQASAATIQSCLNNAREYAGGDSEWRTAEKCAEDGGVDALFAIVEARVLSSEPASRTLKETLLKTGDAELVFLTEEWEHWGVKLSRKGQCLSRKEREEMNTYGKALMRAREELKKPEWRTWLEEARSGKSKW